MMIYVLICIALAMSGVAGLQFFYLAYVERVSKQQTRRIRELERQNAILYHRWQDAENHLTNYQELESAEELVEEEVWEEIIIEDN